MASTFKTNLDEIKTKVTEIGISLLESNKLLLSALGECEAEKFNEARLHIKNITAKADEVDNAIIKVLALYNS